MSAPHPEIVVLVVVLVCLALAPVASKLVADIGAQISTDVGGPPAADDAFDPAEEYAQLIEARAFVRGEEAPDVAAEVQRVQGMQVDPAMREEIREMVEAINDRRAGRGQPELDVEAEVAKRLALYFGAN